MKLSFDLHVFSLNLLSSSALRGYVILLVFCALVMLLRAYLLVRSSFDVHPVLAESLLIKIVEGLRKRVDLLLAPSFPHRLVLTSRSFTVCVFQQLTWPVFSFKQVQSTLDEPPTKARPETYFIALNLASDGFNLRSAWLTAAPTRSHH